MTPVLWVYKHLNSHIQTASPGTSKCRSYNYLFGAGIEPAIHLANRTVNDWIIKIMKDVWAF